MSRALRALADHVGIVSAYVDHAGRRRVTRDTTREALLEALGLEAGDAGAAARSLDARRAAARGRILEPVAVHRGRTRPAITVRLPAARGGTAVAYQLELIEEDGRVTRAAGSLAGGRPGGRLRVPLPRLPAAGYHSVRLELSGRCGERDGAQLLVVAPPTCFTTREALAGRGVFGLAAQLYALRSARDCGVGDFGALDRLLGWAGEIGAAFVAVNPLHALRNAGADVSPYGPRSRLYRNPLYLDLAAVPELAHTDEARRLLEAPDRRAAVERLRTSPRVEYEHVAAWKEPVLRALFRAFCAHHRAADTTRGRAFARYVASEGRPLTDFATFLALDAHVATHGGRRPWWRWPAPYRDHQSAEVARFRERHADDVDFHRWVQFELDRQVAELTSRAKLPLGMLGDLALASAADGSDAWTFPDLFAREVTLGAPPDAYATRGQDWGLPPVSPLALRGTRYAYWILVLRHALAHVGGLRLDHVMGLLRQYWIPNGFPATHGAYVRFPAEELLAILAVESRRHRTLIVGEDLGTLPAGLPQRLARWGILSTRVLYFERDGTGAFRPARHYSRRALVTATTHDHPPLAGFWEGRDLALRRAVGDLSDDEALARARAARDRDRGQLLRRLVAERCLVGMPRSPAELAGAAHRFLARTPAPLVAASLDDLTGETEPVNLPGVATSRFPSWTRKLSRPLEALRDDPEVARALAGMRARRAP